MKIKYILKQIFYKIIGYIRLKLFKGAVKNLTDKASINLKI